jgi:hypothetical protein
MYNLKEKGFACKLKKNREFSIYDQTKRKAQFATQWNHIQKGQNLVSNKHDAIFQADQNNSLNVIKRLVWE